MTRRRLAVIKAVVFAVCLVPLLLLVARGFGIGDASLGANPVQEVLHVLGTTALNFMVIGLAITPLRKITGFNVLARFRRMLGLFFFFYLVLHFLTYALLDWRLDWATLWDDIAERPFITVGFAALVAMIPLAVTSTQGMQRRLGRNWARLHRLVYGIAVLGVVHFYWQSKADVSQPLVYALVVATLLGYRAAGWVERRNRRARVAMAASQ
jgi:methionine sulfoxide reductase heme-binding subunit